MTGKPAHAIATMALLIAGSCVALAPAASAARPLEDVDPLIVAIGDLAAQEIRDAGGEAIDLVDVATSHAAETVLWLAATEEGLNAYVQELERGLADDADAAVAGLVTTVNGAHPAVLQLTDESTSDLVDALRALQGFEERGTQRLAVFDAALLTPLPGVVQDTFDTVPLPSIPIRVVVVISVAAVLDAVVLLAEGGVEGILADPTQPLAVIGFLVYVDVPAIQAALTDYADRLVAAIDDVPGPASAYASSAVAATTVFAEGAAADTAATADAIVGGLSD